MWCKGGEGQVLKAGRKGGLRYSDGFTMTLIGNIRPVLRIRQPPRCLTKRLPPEVGGAFLLALISELRPLMRGHRVAGRAGG